VKRGHDKQVRREEFRALVRKWNRRLNDPRE